MASPPNFDVLDGPSRLWRESGVLGRDYHLYFVYDNLRDRWYNVQYNVLFTGSPDDPIEWEDDDPEEDLAQWLKLMESDGHDLLIKDLDGHWTTANTAQTPCPEGYYYGPQIFTYNTLSDFPAGLQTIRMGQLNITGAVQPSVFVVGQWEFIFKRIIAYGWVLRIAAEIRTRETIGAHPHVLPIHSLVLRDDTHEVAGILLAVLRGGTWAERGALKMKWVRQLIWTVDDFRTKYGIIHQDIAPRNILVDEGDNIRLIDFAESISRDEFPDRDIDGYSAVIAVYEAITKRNAIDDGELHWVQDPDRIRQRAANVLAQEWSPKVQLDVDVDKLKDLLGRWLRDRDDMGYRPLKFSQCLPESLRLLYS